MFVPNSSTGRSSSNLRDKQNSLTNDSGSAEQLRMAHIKVLRDNAEKARAKSDLEQKKRLFELNKRDADERVSLVRRWEGELVRDIADAATYHQLDDKFKEKITQEKTQIHETGDTIQKLQSELQEEKTLGDRLSRELTRLQAEDQYRKKMVEGKDKLVVDVQQKKMREQKEIARLHAINQRLAVEIKSLELKAR